MNERFTITIVGGGMTGLALAALLARDSRFAVRVIDKGPAPTFDPSSDVDLRVSAIAPASANLLDCAGAWQQILDRRASPYERMQVWDAGVPPCSPASVQFDAAEFAVPELGHIVENELIRYALYETLAQSRVILDFDTPIEGIEYRGDRYRLLVPSGAVDSDLLVGADGGQSLVRESAGIDVKRNDYEQTALVTHVATGKPHAGTAWQRFLPTGPIGLLPLADGRVSVVWSTTPDIAEAALDQDEVALGKELSEASDYVLGDLTVAGPRGAFPLRSAHAERYVEPGLALVGDAAHTVHPLAGQGVNLGFADVAELASVLSGALDAGEYPADRPVLRRYERARRGENAGMITLLTGLNGLFASDSPVVGELRRVGMQLFNLSGPIRGKAVDIALGTPRR